MQSDFLDPDQAARREAVRPEISYSLSLTAAMSLSGRDIGELPAVVDPATLRGDRPNRRLWPRTGQCCANSRT